MASVSFTDLFLHSVSDNSDLLSIEYSSFVEVPAGDVRGERRANGRIQMISRPGLETSFDITALFVSRADVDEFRERVGVLQMLRDGRGRVKWGFIPAASLEEFIASDQVQAIKFTFVESTFDDSV